MALLTLWLLLWLWQCSCGSGYGCVWHWGSDCGTVVVVVCVVARVCGCLCYRLWLMSPLTIEILLLGMCCSRIYIHCSMAMVMQTFVVGKHVKIKYPGKIEANGEYELELEHEPGNPHDGMHELVLLVLLVLQVLHVVALPLLLLLLILLLHLLLLLLLFLLLLSALNYWCDLYIQVMQFW